jgi:hypothetical protein
VPSAQPGALSCESSTETEPRPDVLLIRDVRGMRSGSKRARRPGHGSWESDRGCSLGTVCIRLIWHASGTTPVRPSHGSACSADPRQHLGAGRCRGAHLSSNTCSSEDGPALKDMKSVDTNYFHTYLLRPANQRSPVMRISVCWNLARQYRRDSTMLRPKNIFKSQDA